MIIGLAGAVTALIGWFGFHSVIALFIGTALYIVETIIEWRNLNSNAKILDIVIFAIGSIVAVSFTSAQWYIGGMVAIAIYNLIISIIGFVTMPKSFF